MKTVKAFTKLIVLIVVFIATSCKEDDANDPIKPNDPVLELATISTDEVTIFTKTTATITGKVVSDGGSAITEKGFCFGTTTAPTITSNKISSGPAKEDFTANITGLSLNTTYYFRTYATNSTGTAYGNEVILKTTGIDIYLAGGTENNAGYWKNGVYTALTTANIGSFATAITMSDNDLYATGYDGNFMVTWKNGVMTKITDGHNLNLAAADIVVNGSDVYVGGWELVDSKSVAKYWKNGVDVSISDGTNDSAITAMFVSGNDVYACGYEMNNGVESARLWKNGVGVSVTDDTNESYAMSIFVKGTDIYVGGYERSTNGVIVAKYWKNGVATVLSDGTNLHAAVDIFVSDDNTVYTTGFSLTTDFLDGESLLWKNTDLTVLPYDISLGYGKGRKVFVSGSDVYVYGTNGNRTIVWKNGSQMAPYNGGFSDDNGTSDMFIADK
jgi:hypothetical protein